MVFKLKCKFCGNIVTYDSDAKQEAYRKCGECGTLIDMRAESKLNNVAALDDFELIGIERPFEARVLVEDLSHIDKIYNAADKENQEKIATIVDTVYLLLLNADETTLFETENLLRKYFLADCERKGRELLEILNRNDRPE